MHFLGTAWIRASLNLILEYLVHSKRVTTLLLPFGIDDPAVPQVIPLQTNTSGANYLLHIVSTHRRASIEEATAVMFNLVLY